MNDSAAAVIRQLLLDLGLGVAASYSDNKYTGQAWPVFNDGEPASPDNCITVYETQGQDDGRDMISGEQMTHVGFQIRVRAVDQPTGRPKINTIRTGLSTQVGYGLIGSQRYVTVGSNRYTVWAIAGIGNVITVGKESPSSTRFIFTLNALAAIRPWQ